MQGLLIVVKAVHGTRQGVISASLTDATVQLTELGSISQRPHVITTLDDALVMLSRPLCNTKWFHSNAVHPGKSTSAHSLPAAAVVQSMLRIQELLMLLKLQHTGFYVSVHNC